MDSLGKSGVIPLPSDEELTSSPPPFSPPPLPQLTDFPQTIPDSCLSLSIPLLSALHALLPPAPTLTLSIGSGTGLVEALLQSLPDAAPLNLVSVEVAPSPNKYHHPHRTVPGTWAVEGLAREAAAWMFVYPKQVALVREYMRLFVEGPGPEVVVYVGPRMDWGDFGGALEGGERQVEVWGEEGMEEVGGRGWEVVAVVRRTGR
ncbi:hypothetical protein GCG54_00003633 [Colletotrichum gloeosporioides]|uniref:Uncharacterized protein n=1 Tax=Colletotrichum gloeosporioides TaxID=474922 RepID=A0A8H4CXC8_COLGL|nr:uncharacterized protein GCG54_00003633 [Colletotrichum gloeosporioides]KAF3811884.1 hypothetical protein GCG54_00003633 [Colletotrichum gloeosporioides]